MQRYAPAVAERATRDVVSRSAFLEMMAGRACPEGGVHIVAAHLGAEFVVKNFPGMCERCRQFDYDLARGACRSRRRPTSSWAARASTARQGLLAAPVRGRRRCRRRARRQPSGRQRHLRFLCVRPPGRQGPGPVHSRRKRTRPGNGAGAGCGDSRAPPGPPAALNGRRPFRPAQRGARTQLGQGGHRAQRPGSRAGSERLHVAAQAAENVGSPARATTCPGTSPSTCGT